MLPCSHIAGLKGICQTVIIALDYKRIKLTEQFALLAADLLFFVSKMGRIQLITEGSAHGDHSLRLQGDEFAAV